MKDITKTFILLVLLCSCVLVTFVFPACSKKQLESKEIKIGAVLPLTGSAAIWGENAKMGMELALAEINNASDLRGKKLRILYEDSQSLPSIAVSALQKLISTDHVTIVIGDIASSSVLAMAPIAEKQKVVLLSPGASNPDISYAGDYIFRNWQSDALEGDIDARFAYNKLQCRRVAILYVNNAYGTGLKDIFESVFQNLGGKIVISESFQQGDTDMRTQLRKIVDVNPELIYMPGYPSEMAIVLRQAREMGTNIQFLSVQAFDDPKIIETAGNAAEGVIYSIPKPPDMSNEIVSNFVKEYEEKFNKKPGVCSDTGYDAVKIIYWAIEQTKEISGEAIREQLLKLKDFPGAAGAATFDSNGDVIRDFIFKKIKAGKAVQIGNG